MVKTVQMPSGASLPSAVTTEYLAQQGIPFREIQDDVTLSADRKVYGALFDSDDGNVLALFPANKMLYPSRCCNCFCGNMSVRNRLLHFNHAIGHLQPSSSVLALPCIYDPELFEQPCLLLNSGQPSTVWEVNSRDFRQLLPHNAYGMPIATVPQDGEGALPTSSFTSRRTEQRIQNIGDLPLLPQTLNKLLKTQATSQLEAQELIGLIETDPSLAAQVLSWACLSCCSGYVESVEEAVLRILDVNLTQELVYAMLANHSWFPARENWQPALEYCHTALQMAVVVDGLVHMLPAQYQAAAGLGYLAGLLHNIGDWLLMQRFPSRYADIRRHQQANPHIPPESIERHFLGMTANEAGASLLRRWSLPEAVCSALIHQRDPDYQGEYAIYANLIYLASALLEEHTSGHVRDRHQAVFERWEIGREQARETVIQILEIEQVLLSRPH